ncbi:MAG: hypothetical protein WAR79_06050 [Melioribacteraceae bacterium]
MKRHLQYFAIMLSIIVFNSTTFAQDSNAVRNQNQIKEKVNNGKQTQKLHGRNFVDEDGDGYNDNAPDHDGDGIPNGLDEDYNGNGKNSFVDLDGDGINDNSTNGNGYGARKGLNSNHGLNKNSVGAQNGNVNGAGNNTGNTDGTTSGKTRKGRGGRGN